MSPSSFGSPSHPRQPRRHTRGFSLVELIVAVGLLGVVSTIAVTMFVRMSDLWNGMEANVEMNDRADYAFARMQEDIAELIPPAAAQQPLTVASGAHKDDQYFWGIDLADDTLALPTRVVQEDKGLRRIARVEYRIDRSTWTLVRATAAPGEEAGLELRPTTAAEGVVQFSVACLDGEGNWRDSWSELDPPLAIRVTLVLMDPAQPWQQIARTAVWPVRVG